MGNVREHAFSTSAGGPAHVEGGAASSSLPDEAAPQVLRRGAGVFGRAAISKPSSRAATQAGARSLGAAPALSREGRSAKLRSADFNGLD